MLIIIIIIITGPTKLKEHLRWP